MGNSTQTGQTDDCEVFLNAVKKGEFEKVVEFCQNGIQVNCRDKDEATPIMWACSLGHIQVIKKLISFGANLTDCDKDNYTALHHAVTNKQEHVVQLLVTQYRDKLNINARNKQGDTPLHRSAHYGVEKIASLLITNGAEINPLNDASETPLDKARSDDIRKLLKCLGAKHNVKTPQIEGGAEAKQNAADDVKVNVLSDAEKQFLVRQEMENKVSGWLTKELCLPEYVPLFIDNGYDRFDAVLAMEKEDLKDIGVKMGHIKIILNSIRDYKANQQKIAQFEKQNEPGMNDIDQAEQPNPQKVVRNENDEQAQ